MANDEIVGHKTFSDGRGGFTHEPLTKTEADAIMVAVEAASKRRADLMPTEREAVKMLWDAHQRLKELGWREAQYAPANIKGQIIELGSSGIHHGHTDEERHWWIPEEGDEWPSKPCLYKEKPPGV